MPATPLIDSHCHLDFETFDNDRSDVLRRAKDNNISDIVIPGTEKIYWDRISSLCKNHSQLHACYGLHPYWINEQNKPHIESLKRYIELNRPVALGECGLDFRPQQAEKKLQLYFFEAQLGIAEQNQLPVVIHSVRATETVIQRIKKFSKLRGMIHSYSGSLQQAKQLVDLNFYISVGGSVTYDNAKNIKQVVKEIPLASLLIETDSPDQPDKKNKGKRNEPAYILSTVKAISEIRDESVDMIARQTTINAKKLFAI
ncbi:MAG: TatD family hydrolase [Proteobacteria bacterium]|nr:TatD family hydrolase [Pseudomonadota bacterium]